MNGRAIVLQSLIFIVQWGLMLIGFGLISRVIAPRSLIPETTILLRYIDAGVKAMLGLVLSLAWLFIWDRQVRLYFYRKVNQSTRSVT